MIMDSNLLISNFKKLILRGDSVRILKKIWLNEWFRILFILPFPLWCLPLAVIYGIDVNLIIAFYLILFVLACKYNN